MIEQNAVLRVPTVAWLAIGALALSGAFATNSSLTLALSMLLAWILMLLYRPGEPQILLLAAVFQWLQVGVKVLHANLLGEPVEALAQYQGDVAQATWLSILALAVLVLGMRLAIGPYRENYVASIRSQGELISPERAFILYVALSLASVALLTGGRYAAGLYQSALAFAGLKWAAYFVFAYVCFVKLRFRAVLLMVFGFEFVLSLGGYFSGFKAVFFVTSLAYLATGKRLGGLHFTMLAALVSVLLVVSLMWTAVKTGYRDYLSGGQQAQIVTVGYVDRVQELARQVYRLEPHHYGAAAYAMAERIAYVDFFGSVLDWVPTNLAHTGGTQWGGALLHVLAPRLLWPEKPPLPNDSEVTMQFSGLVLPSSEEGTSISLGYVAESYVDFGLIGMFLPILMLGMVWGGIYRYFVNLKTGMRLLNSALVIPILLMAMQFEAVLVKLLGSVLTSFLVAWFVHRFAFDYLTRFLAGARAYTTSGEPAPSHSTWIR
jgi:hypothetical protein